MIRQFGYWLWYIIGMASDCRAFTRKLFAWEVQEARRVFAGQIHYERVRVHECSPFPNWANRVGSRLKGVNPPSAPIAITLGNHCYFPVRLPEFFIPPGHSEHFKIPWLIHELTHVWQYQRLGWRYLPQALKAQFRHGAEAYNFGGEEGLLERLAQGARFADFNLEQQGDIARSYYERLVQGKTTAAWDRFIADVQAADSPIYTA